MGFGSSFAFIFLLIAATWFPQHYFGFFSAPHNLLERWGHTSSWWSIDFIFLAQVHSNWRLDLATIGVFGVILTFLSLLIVKNKLRSQRNIGLLEKT